MKLLGVADFFLIRIVVVLFVLVIFPSKNNADTYSPKVEFGPFVSQDIKVGPGTVFAGQRLWGTKIVGQDLRNASFENCDLSHVYIAQCDLRGVSFKNATLQGLATDDCTFGSNSFEGAVINGWSDSGSSADLPKSLILPVDQLKSTWSFRNKNLSNLRVVFSRNELPSQFSLAGFDLKNTTFVDVDFQQSITSDAHFLPPEMIRCKLDLAKWLQVTSRRNFTDFKFEDCTFTQPVDLSDAVLWNTVMSGKSIQVISLKNARISGLQSNWLTRKLFEESATFKTRDYSRIHFPADGGFDGMDFSGTNLSGATFYGEIGKCKFDDAIITAVRFWNTEGLTLAQLKSTWNYRHGQMQTVSLPQRSARGEPPRGMVFSGPELNGTDFSGWDLQYTKFVGEVGECNFTDARLEEADLTESTGLTIEQIQSTRTYNRENGPFWSDIDRIKLPSSLLKELEADPAIRHIVK